MLRNVLQSYVNHYCYMFFLKKWLLLFIYFSQLSTTIAQTVVQGNVTDVEDNPISFANAYLKDIYDGGPANETGNFSFSTAEVGKATLIISYTGYKSFEKTIYLKGDTILIDAKLMEGENQLGEVTINAGSFEAGDKIRSIPLKPLDIVTTAGANADLYGALQTLPGVAPTNEETGIFVRGGEARETRTFINGLLVQSPFFGDVPDVPSRGRFSPYQFDGTLFSTGAYSAEYGQALSSVLLLNTQSVPANTSTGVGLNMVGFNVVHNQALGDSTSLSAGLGYTNTRPLYKLVRQQVDWQIEPKGFNTSLNFHKKWGLGVLKVLAQYQSGTIALKFPSSGDSIANIFTNSNYNLFSQANYQGTLNEHWTIYSGIGYGYEEENNTFNTIDSIRQESLLQAKVVLGRNITNDAFLKFGVETYQTDNQQFSKEEHYNRALSENYSASFLEAEVNLFSKWALRLGTRAEYSTLLTSFNAAPRTSLAFKTSKNSQISIGYGHFYQTPLYQFLYENNKLDFEKSTHYIANYQIVRENRTFRIEAYYKKYEHLLKRNPSTGQYANDGDGFSRGIDFFWRDRQSAKNLDYWISYSFIDSERNYLEFPESTTPAFISNHVLNAVIKYGVPSIRTRFGATYTWASGRPYNDPNAAGFLTERAPNYQVLNTNISYLLSIFGDFSVIYFSVNNVLGRDNIFSYRFSEDGRERRAIRPSTRRTFFLGIFIDIR